jgi:membrane protein YdbS with pleckstrin-like domain
MFGSMFKGMPKIFWIGMAVMYGWCFLFMGLEMTIPGFPLKMFLGIPACYIYNMILALWIIPTIIAYIFYKSEEKREALLEKGGN